MNELLSQIILAARNNDGESWMNLLFILVVGIFWAVGGILKAKANKAALKEEKPLPGKPKPARKPPERRRALQELQKQPSQKPAPAVRAAQRKQRRQMVPQPAAPQQRRKVVRPQVEPVIQELAAPEIGLKPEEIKLQPLVTGLKDTGAAAVKAASAIVSLDNLTEGDNLKMAIIYAEILGKPLALRDR
jgi:hypothetical protein